MFNKQDIKDFAYNAEGVFTDKMILFCDYTREKDRLEKFIQCYCEKLSEIFELDSEEIFRTYIFNNDITNINFYVIKDFCKNLIEIYELHFD